MSDQFSIQNPLTATGSKKQPNKSASSFIETLRDQTKDVTTGLAGNILDQLRAKAPSQLPNNNSPQAPESTSFNFTEFDC